MKAVEIDADAENIEDLIQSWFAEGIDHSSWYLDILTEYAKKVDSVTEFGIFQGHSLAAFLRAKPKVLKAYDIDFKHFTPEPFIRLKGNTELTIGSRSSLTLACDQTDLLYLDTVHTYNHVLRELRLHSDSVNKWIFIHDTKKDEVHEACFLHAIEGDFIVKQEWKEKQGMILLERNIPIENKDLKEK